MIKVENPPLANFLMGSMRYMGYSFNDAVADIIDNSISANAKTIKVLFTKDPSNLYVGILDDGRGMSSNELFRAMCYGSQANEVEREATDLGRFGLGMKSASLSQCKKLTVVSKCNNNVSAYRWDYDEVSKKSNNGKWYILKLEDKEILKLNCIDEFNEIKEGTLVLWEDFDVLSKTNGGLVYESLTRHRDSLLDHLALIYHRFISECGVKIFVNYAPVVALDPFLSKRSDITWGTIRQPMLDSNGNQHFIEITPYKLPFITDMNEDERRLIGGDDKMNRMQGYYIYRGKRLIKYGTWFGTPRHEVSKYGRVKVDIPNSMDDIWKIDVMKRNASIPRELSRLLEKTIAKLKEKSSKQTRFRGQPVTSDSEKEVYIWNRIECRDGFYSYTINKDNSFIKAVYSQIPDTAKHLVDMMLNQIAKNLPIHQLHLDHDENRIFTEDEYADAVSDLVEQAICTINYLNTSGFETKSAVDKVLSVDPFRDNDVLRDIIVKKYNL